ncbi:hypothetical protein CBR_g17939 [Chara braunii]|uniref:Phosphoglycerate mutase-like protein n=1 Tax=Chara braunii TaxID=69332 RepID=A0A388KW02_CHABU|nr:hypothetical protein CBR_g17939 [Chara braunii]|eukprot:GBG74227.1 hypothetical protein CBR_g17939 [Chara braunii]
MSSINGIEDPMTVGGTAGSRRGGASRLENDKLLYLVRHGTTEMNECIANARLQGVKNFVDPMLYDTKLSERGLMQAENLAKITAALHGNTSSSNNASADAIELIVLSPLGRAMKTAELGFKHVEAARVICPLARERVFYSSDVGRSPSVLSQEFPYLDFTELDEIWWHTDGSGDPMAVVPEPDDVFAERIARLREWLLNRPEKVIAVVSHWAVLQALTRRCFQNCELFTCYLSETFPIATQKKKDK